MQIIANEVLDRLRDAGRGARATSTTAPWPGPGQRVAALPVPDPVPAVRRGPPRARHPAGRRRGLRRRATAWAASATSSPAGLGGEEARNSFHLYESLALLFRMVNDGHRAPGRCLGRTGAVRGRGPPVRAAEGRPVRPGADPADRPASPTRLTTRTTGRAASTPGCGTARCTGCSVGSCSPRAAARKRQDRAGRLHLLRPARHQPARRGVRGPDVLHRVHRRRGTVRGREERRPVRRILDDPRVQGPRLRRRRIRQTKDENGFQTGERVRYRPGSFVYRLAGRDRQTSASYYTPQSLTSVTVQLTLEQRVKEQGGTVTAAEVLRLAGLRACAWLWRVPQRGHRPARRPVSAAARGRDR